MNEQNMFRKENFETKSTLNFKDYKIIKNI